MAKCVIHSSSVANDAVCGRCKSCSHKTWFRKEGEEIYQCDGCFRVSKKPIGEKWTLTKEGWKEDK